MTVSGFHHHFKSVTAMSPLQYQKQIRLQEARRLMLGEDLDAASAGFRVGYEDPHHTSAATIRSSSARPLSAIFQACGADWTLKKHCPVASKVVPLGSIRRKAQLKFFDENSSGRQCRLAAAAIYGSRPRSLLSAEPNRVTVLEVVAHVSSERDGDRLRVCRISRRSVADVDSLHIDDPSG